MTTSRPYLRAYLAGLAFPTLLVPVVLLGYVIARYGLAVPVPLERGLIFPLALAPNIYGLWNMLYQRVHRTSSIGIGLFGALLPFVMAPCGYLAASALGLLTLGERHITWFGEIQVPYTLLPVGFCIGITIYYLAWKYVVNFFNETLGIA
jgi:hypothetical protein